MHKTKYLIVGQGLAGTLLSWELSKRRKDHMLIGTYQKPSASLVAAGMYNPLVFKRLTKSWMADTLIPIMKSTFQELEQLLNTALIFEKPIAKLIRKDEKNWWNERIEHQNLQSYFAGFKSNNFMPGIHQNFDMALIKQSGYVNINNLITSYTEYLKGNQQFISAELKYSDITFTNNKVYWQNTEAEHIVFCEGAQAIHNPFFPENVFYLTKGAVLTVEIPGLSSDYIINKDVFIMPRGNQKFLIGSTYKHDNLTLEPNIVEQNYLLEKAQQLIIAPIKVIDHKVGIRPTVKDRRPVLGYHPNCKNIAFFNGLGTKGVMLGPYFANQMATLLTNVNHEINPEVSIKRFYKQ